MPPERRVTGIGGIFFKARDPDAMARWYEERLGIAVEPAATSSEDGEHERSGMFHWREHDDPEAEGMTIWAVFPERTSYFFPGQAPFMVNYRVRDLDQVLEELKREGVWIDERREDTEYGRFAWIQDPEGNRIELWQPPAS
jgi:predicted enzyme related to lactoylglutathione lyase